MTFDHAAADLADTFIERTEALFGITEDGEVTRQPSADELVDHVAWAAKMLPGVVSGIQWQVSGVIVPPEAMAAVKRAPRNQRESVKDGIRAVIAGIAKDIPNLARVLDAAIARREEGKVFAEAGRERRDAQYRERVVWVAKVYAEVRGKYRDGVPGDRAARLEVAEKFKRTTRAPKRMHDRTICNLLKAAKRHMRQEHTASHE